MLHLASEPTSDDEREPPSSPIRRLTQPVLANGLRNNEGASGRRSVLDVVVGAEPAEFVASNPAAQSLKEANGIKKEAFSPNYFKKFFVVESELGRGGKGVVLLVRHELDGVFLGMFPVAEILSLKFVAFVSRERDLLVVANMMQVTLLVNGYPLETTTHGLRKVPTLSVLIWPLLTCAVLIEVQLLQQLSHPNLVSYRHVWLEDVKLNRFGPSVPCAFILQQYCNSGDLLHYVIGKSGSQMNTNEQLKEQMRRRSKGQSERPLDLKLTQKKLGFDEIYSFFKDITSGLAHLHAANYIHRDLKPSNCLLHKSDKDFRCLISDFGEVQAENVYRKSTGATGTISYCAPEVLRQDASGRYGNFTAKSDIFSLGMILYFMCFGRLPYLSAENIQEEFEDLDQLREEISSWQGFQDERQERPDLPDQLYTFLKRLLSINPLDRPSAEEILQAISAGSGLGGPPSLNRAKNNLGVGKRIQPVESPIPGTNGKGGQRASSAAYFEDEGNEILPPVPQALSTRAESQLRKTQSDQLEPLPEVMTPLLMPPPTPEVETFKRRLVLAMHAVRSWAILNRWLLTYVAKLAIFLFKVYTLASPCLPWATNPLVASPLLILAAFDLGLGARMEWRMTALLLLIHAATLATVSRYGSMCASGRDIWEWESDIGRREGGPDTLMG